MSRVNVAAALVGIGVLAGWWLAEAIDRGIARLLGTDALGRWWR